METLHVDPIACGGHRICAELLPEWIRLDDWGYPIVRRGAVPPELTAPRNGRLPTVRPLPSASARRGHWLRRPESGSR